MSHPWTLVLPVVLGFSGYASAQATQSPTLGTQAHQVTVQCTLTHATDAPCAQEARRGCAGDAKLKQIVSHTAMPVTEGVDQHADSLVRYVAIYSCSH
ncbi:hypothetical protein [Dyella sp. GSA-30]|uniref:hypothetical protein n=1 Tax=Dyella sp. GSA-30 TaxID=2994496 RepID=UPI0024905E71|nr:hypothetical protein [Dyella sp. GSA-30]BDU19381.1 hypothetical protein DYGSA30_08380 [Dyella sp. GSA-30]